MYMISFKIMTTLLNIINLENQKTLRPIIASSIVAMSYRDFLLPCFLDPFLLTLLCCD